MLGTLRLALALAVAAYHVGWRPGGVQMGGTAVVMFYIISGYAMSGLGRALLAGPAGAGALRFWRDRLLRLYPQYLFWLVLAAAVRFGTGRMWLFQHGPLGWSNALANLTIFPLSLYMYVPAWAQLMLIPPAWSLSTELGFYALFPLIWRSRTATWALALGGCCVLALAATDILPAEWYSYRLLPGTLPFFLLGRAMFLRDRALLATLAALFTAIAANAWATGHQHTGFNTEIALALLLGPPAIALAVRIPPWRWDALCGHASYGAYLAHITLIVLGVRELPTLPARVAAITLLSAAAGLLSYWLIERPVNRYRRRLRGREPQS